MTPTPESLPDAPWLTDPATRSVIAALEAAGGPGCARFVGGCVRNGLLARPVDDIDIATVLTPDQVMAALKTAGIKSVPTGVEHGTVTAIADGRPFEVTTLRRDVETDGRRAVVAFTTDWVQDAQRRDFRLNALYMDGAGRIYDPTGQGVSDALAGRIVFVGQAEQRIREDYLRILRFFRFRAWFGRGAPDAEGVAACAALKDGLCRLSAERVSKELLKLLAAEDPRQAVAEMDRAGVLAEVLPEARSLDRFVSLVEIEQGHLGMGDAELRFAALLPNDAGVAIEVAHRLRLSNAQRERLAAAVDPDPQWSSPWDTQDSRTTHRLLYRLGSQAFRDQLRLAWASSPSSLRQPSLWMPRLAQAQSWTPPKFPLTGRDASALGLGPGPELGKALKQAEAYWVEHDFQPDRAALIALLKR